MCYPIYTKLMAINKILKSYNTFMVLSVFMNCRSKSFLFLFYTHTWFKSIIFGLPQVSHVKAALCREGKELGGIRNFRFLIF